MKHTQIRRYNQPGNLLVVTNYPPRGRGVHAAKIGGVSGFAKNTLIPLAKKYAREGRKIIVLADMLRATPEIYEEDNMLIVRAWRRDHPSMYLTLLRWFITFRRVGDVFVEFEFASFGDFVTTALFPVLMLMLRLSGKRVTIALHQVITDLWSIIGHIGLYFDSGKFKLLSALLPVYYFVLTHFANETVVLEEEFKKRLIKLAPPDNISVIPHGIETIEKLPTKKKSRRMLGLDPDEFIVTSLGFITWYKGTDMLVRLFEEPLKVAGKRVRLMIAGGSSTSQKDKDHYKKFYSSVKEMAHGKKHITITGFIPDTKIAQYLAASDVVVFPYRTLMSSSGPLSLALAHKKQILLSKALMPLLHSSDYADALGIARLSPDAFLMPETAKGLVKRLEYVVKPGMKKRMRKFLSQVHTKRNFNDLTRSYYTVLTPDKSRNWNFKIQTIFGGV